MYALVPLQTTYLEIFSCVCSYISNLAHRNSPKLAQIVRLTIWSVSRKSYIRIYRYALVPLQTTYLEIFSCVCSYISNLVHRNSPKLAQIIRLIAILLSGEFEENRILGSTDICLGIKYCTLVQFGTESPTQKYQKDFRQNCTRLRGQKSSVLENNLELFSIFFRSTIRFS